MSHRETELYELGVCLLSTPDSPTSYPAFEDILIEASNLPDFVVSDVGHLAWAETHKIVTVRKVAEVAHAL